MFVFFPSAAFVGLFSWIYNHRKNRFHLNLFKNTISLDYRLSRRDQCCTLYHCSWTDSVITKTCLFQYTEYFTTQTENFRIKIFNIFLISAQNIDCGYSLEPPRWGGSNEYPQAMFLSRNKKNNVYPCKPQFYYIKVGFKGGQNFIGMFSWWKLNLLLSLKAPYSSKIDIFIQERLIKIIYGITTIIKCGTWQPLTFHVVSRFWTGSKMK